VASASRRFSHDDPRRLALQGASAALNGPSLPPANPNRGFELMKIAGVETSLGMDARIRTVATPRVSAANRVKMHNNCG